MPQPDRQEYIDNILSDVALGYFQSADNYACLKAFPPVPVTKQEAKYYTFAKNDLLREQLEVRGNGEESMGGGFSLSNTSYQCEVYARHKDVTERDRANWNLSGMTIEESTVQVLTQWALQRMERQWVTDFFTTSIWGTDATGGSTFTVWSNGSSSDPITDIDTGKFTVLSNTGYEPRKLICGYKVWQALKRHPLIVDRVTGGSSSANPGVVSRQAVAAVLDLDEIIVSKAAKATNLEDETAAYSLVAGTNALLCYAPSVPSLVEPSAGYTFMWDAISNGALPDGGVFAVSRIPVPLKGRNAERIELEVGFDNAVTGSDLGYFFSGAVA